MNLWFDISEKTNKFMKPASNRGEKRHLFNKKNGENWIGCFDLARSGEEGVTRPGAIFLDAVPNFERRR